MESIMSDLIPLFRPQSVALIGASSDTKKYGYWTAKSLIDNKFQGEIHLISRSGGEILGQPTYPDILSVPGEVDLAIIAIAPKHILPIIEQCVEKGVKTGIVVSTGFGETGPEGKEIERRMLEIARKGNLKQQALHDGNDLLARYKGTEESAAGKNLSPDEWMKKLLSSEDSGVGLSGCNDPVVEMAVTAFASLMLLAVQIDGRSEQEQKAAVSAAADRRRIDLKPLLPGMRSCELAIGENGRATLLADNGNVRVSRELTPAEMSRLSAALNDGTLSEEARRMRVAGLLNSVVLAETASRNFELGMAEQRGQTENLKR